MSNSTAQNTSRYHFIATFETQCPVLFKVEQSKNSSMMIMIKCKYNVLILQKCPVTSQSLSNLMSGKASPQKQLRALHLRERLH